MTGHRELIALARDLEQVTMLLKHCESQAAGLCRSQFEAREATWPAFERLAGLVNKARWQIEDVIPNDLVARMITDRDMDPALPIAAMCRHPIMA